MKLDTEHLERCIRTLERSLQLLERSKSESIEYEVYRNATVKGFELALETAGKLLRKSLKPYFAGSRAVDGLSFKDLPVRRETRLAEHRRGGALVSLSRQPQYHGP